MSDVRPSPIAGTWYPADAETLARSVDKQLAEASDEPPPGTVVGLIAPHAGHRYSGAVAAHAFRLISGDQRDCVAILSPMHHPYAAAVLSSTHEAYETPLGPVPVDRSRLDWLTEVLAADSGIDLSRISCDPEHSLEIELPFLQRTLSHPFRLIPIMLRDQSPRVARAVGRALARVLAGAEALIVASSDLSHFYPGPVARRLDSEMLARLESFDPEAVLSAEDQGVGFACGKGALAAALWAARDLGATGVRMVNYAHSGDVTGDQHSVVGYGAGVIFRTASALGA